MATGLKRTESVISPQLFHFDDHFEFEHVIGRSNMSEVWRAPLCRRCFVAASTAISHHGHASQYVNS